MREVNGAVRQVEEERLVLAGVDELHRRRCVALDDALLLVLPHGRDDRLIFDKRERWLTRAGEAGLGVASGTAGLWFGKFVAEVALRSVLAGPHVVRVRDAEVVIETTAARQEFRLIAEVPFSDARRRVAGLLQQLRHRALGGTQADRGAGKEHVRNRQHALGIGARHQRRARRRAHRRGVETRELAPFPRHAVEVRRAVELRPKRPDVRIAQVVDVDDDEVGPVCRGRGAGKQAE